MIQSEQPFQLLYVSTLAPDASDEVVAEIVAVSRPRNLACEISGALLFDGARFCQLLEGTETQVRLLMRSIEIDARHNNVNVLAASYCVLPRLLDRWVSGHCDTSDLNDFVGDSPVREEVALALFMSVLKNADLD